MSDKLRVGIIGTGLVGRRHIHRYQSMHDDVEIVAVADINVADAQRIGQENGIPYVFSNYHDLLNIDAIDSVDVCLPNFLHAPVTIAALETGKHVYCEKPMAPTSAEAQTMYDTAQRTGKKLAVQLRTLFSKETRTAKYLIEEGALGRTYYAKTSRYLRRARVYVDGYATPHFVQKEQSGGGALIDVGVYQIARMVYLLDNPEIETVTASTFQLLDMDEKRRRESGYNVEELGAGLVRFKGDITMFVETAWAVNLDGGDGDCIMGSKGGLRLEPLAFYVDTKSDESAQKPFTFYTDVYGIEADVHFNIEAYERRMRLLGYMGEGYDDPQQHFVWGVLGRIKMIDTGAIGLTVVSIIEAMYRSAEERREINLR